MRLFIAIEFNKEIKDTLLKTLHELKKAGVGGKYVPGDNLHLTLAFIGESNRATEIKEAINAVKFKPFKPHVTLIRNATNFKLQNINIPPVQMEVKGISLMKSENKGGKIVYTRI